MKKILTLLIYLMPLMAVSQNVQNSICFNTITCPSANGQSQVYVEVDYTNALNFTFTFEFIFLDITNNNNSTSISKTESFNGTGRRSIQIASWTGSSHVNFDSHVFIQYRNLTTGFNNTADFAYSLTNTFLCLYNCCNSQPITTPANQVCILGTKCENGALYIKVNYNCRADSYVDLDFDIGSTFSNWVGRKKYPLSAGAGETFIKIVTPCPNVNSINMIHFSGSTFNSYTIRANGCSPDVSSVSNCCINATIPACNYELRTTVIPITCNNAYGAVYAATRGGTQPYKWLWSNGAIGPRVESLNAGTYQLTVSDASNCETVSTISIAECQDCGTLATTKSATCTSNGSIDLRLSIIMWYFPVTLTWSDGVTNVIARYEDLSNSAQVSTNGTGTFTRNNVVPGTYTVEITNNGGWVKCKRTATVTKNCDCTAFINQCKTEWEQEFWRRYGNGFCKTWETDCNTSSNIRRNGRVAIGPNIRTVPDGFNLGVEGGVIANEVKVQLCRADPNNAWCDYVFNEKYKLKPLLEVSSYLKANKRLHNMPSTADIDKIGGYDLGKIALLQQEKVEEIYLHLISLNEKVIALNTRIEQKKQANSRLKKRIQKMK